MDPELDLLLDDGERELDGVGVDAVGSEPGEGDGALVVGVGVGDGGLGMVLAAADEVADGLVDAELADELAAFLGVDQEAAEGGGTVLSVQLKVVKRQSLSGS